LLYNNEDYLIIKDSKNKKYAVYFEEFIEGVPLNKIIADKSSFDILDIINFIDEMTKNLKVLADNKIVHRDIKPQNIIFSSTNQYILIDFGIGRNYFEDTNLTVSYQTIGTRKYLSPEQRTGVPSTYKWNFKNDLYAVGLIAMEMFLPETRVRDINSNINLKDLMVKWKEKSTNDTEITFFKKVMIKLLAENRFERFDTIEEIEEILTNIRLEVVK